MSEIKVSMNPVSNELLDKVVGGYIEPPENLTKNSLCPHCNNYVTPTTDANGNLCCPVCGGLTGLLLPV